MKTRNKEICTLAIKQATTGSLPEKPKHSIQLLPSLPWRIGNNHGCQTGLSSPNSNSLIADLRAQITILEAKLTQSTGQDHYRVEHQLFAGKRECYEYLLPVRLNEPKLVARGRLLPEYLFELDEQVAEIRFELNQLRIKRRIYDYIVESL